MTSCDLYILKTPLAAWHKSELEEGKHGNSETGSFALVQVREEDDLDR